MIVGHLGVAAALGASRPRVSLWWLLPAAVAPDALDIAYALAGVCNPYGLYSHTIPAALLLGAIVAGAAVLSGRRDAGALALLAVLLHLPLDLVTGNKLYWPGGEMYGLRWYDRRLADFLLESAILAVGWALLRRRPGAPRWATSLATLAALVAMQGAVDVFRGTPLKPTACVTVRRTAGGQSVSGQSRGGTDLSRQGADRLTD